METVGNEAALSDAQFDRLSELLEGIGPAAMNMERLDGFFAALICGPELVMPSEYLPEIWGEDYVFENMEQAQEILTLVNLHWNSIVATLLTTLTRPNVYLPVLLLGEDGSANGNDWAEGFMHGVSMRHESWQIFLEDDDHAGAIIPMMALVHEFDEDPKMRTPAKALEKREQILQYMTAGITQIYLYFAPHRRANALDPSRSGGARMLPPPAAPHRRQGAKVGRNDPCPCGSGRKYKQCCGAN